MIASVRAVLVDSSSGLAQLFYTHFLLPFADVAQVLVFVAMIATALALECPIWTEDADFFGAGVATWTTDRVELFLSESRANPGSELNDD